MKPMCVCVCVCVGRERVGEEQERMCSSTPSSVVPWDSPKFDATSQDVVN